MPRGTVTIILPTYRRPEKLRRAIQSVLTQTYRDVRVMVFDNASRDATREVVRDLIAVDSRVQYYCHEENIGLTANFNFAFDRIDTPYFGILADDDYFLDNFVRDAMQPFEVHPEIQFSVLSAPEVDEEGTFVADQLAAWPKEGLYAPGESILTAVNGAHPILTMCIYRSALVPELKFDKTADSLADLPVLISLLATYPFYLSKKVGGYFVRHAGASGNTFAKLSNYRHFCPAYMRVEQIIRDNSTIEAKTRAAINRALTRRVDKIFFFLMLESLTISSTEPSHYLEGVIRGRDLSFWQIGGLILCALHRHVSSSVLGKCLAISRQVLRNTRRAIGNH